MKKMFLSLFVVCMSSYVFAQKTEKECADYETLIRQEIKDNPCFSASNYLAYPTPTAPLTAAPKGYKPFYISHYGRHGSRYLIGTEDYDNTVSMLSDAEKAGKLTDLGKDVLRRVKMIREESRKREGELTQLGAEQHQQIAARMYERFPEVFKGDVCIDAKSTIVIRCILSMENELHQLLIKNPKLRITHDASEHDMYFMNLQDKALYDKKRNQYSRVLNQEFTQRHVNYNRLLGSLFNDAHYFKYVIDGNRLGHLLFKLASNLQSTELRKQITLYDIFTNDELYELWKQSNANWYLGYGNSKYNGGTQPFSQRNLLRNIIQQADSCIQLERPGATLRFGHETMVMPLTCLLGLNNFDQQVDDLEQLVGRGWVNYKVFPMGANIQFIFYRKQLGGDVIFKVLLNENEATLPLPSDMAPYYRWNDFREYYLKKLSTYKE